jgi:L-rhamnose isomerase/sugar isomerase
VNPNVFQDPRYKFGSFGHADAAVRQAAREHMRECCQIMQAVGSQVLSLWFADGTDYPGQADFRRRKQRFEEELKATYALLPAGARMLIEYKFFEPAFYHTDLADWGMALSFARKCGERAQVLVDLGHHAPGVNIEHIVAFLLDEGRLGGFHFNNRKYADDDLTCGSINPYELFLIFVELTAAEAEPGLLKAPIAYMIDQAHNTKPKLEAMIQSLEHIQTAQAKALLVDRRRLAAAQASNDVVGAERCLTEAFQTDVEPLLKSVREELGAALSPVEAHRASGYTQKMAAQRRGKVAGAGLGVN